MDEGVRRVRLSDTNAHTVADSYGYAYDDSGINGYAHGYSDIHTHANSDSDSDAVHWNLADSDSDGDANGYPIEYADVYGYLPDVVHQSGLRRIDLLHGARGDGLSVLLLGRWPDDHVAKRSRIPIEPTTKRSDLLVSDVGIVVGAGDRHVLHLSRFR